MFYHAGSIALALKDRYEGLCYPHHVCERIFVFSMIPKVSVDDPDHLQSKDGLACVSQDIVTSRAEGFVIGFNRQNRDIWASA